MITLQSCNNRNSYPTIIIKDFYRQQLTSVVCRVNRQRQKVWDVVFSLGKCLLIICRGETVFTVSWDTVVQRVPMDCRHLHFEVAGVVDCHWPDWRATWDMAGQMKKIRTMWYMVDSTVALGMTGSSRLLGNCLLGHHCYFQDPQLPEGTSS